MKIGVWGDSIAFGQGDIQEGGWVTRLKSHFDRSQKKDIDILNLSICGNTTRDLLKRFKAEASACSPEIIIFEIGINDSCRPHLISPVKFKSNLKQLLLLAEKFTHKIAFIGLTNVDDKKLRSIYPLEPQHKNASSMNYDAIIESFCCSNHLPYLSLAGLLDTFDLVDGLHPNSVGHEKIFKKVLPFLEALIEG